MRRRRRVLLAIGASLLTVLLVTTTALAWLLTTRSGFDWALAQARPHLPEGVSFAAAEGRLVGPIELNDLRVETAGATLEVARARLRWQPRALLAGRIHVDRLALEGIDIVQTPRRSKPSDRAPSVPGLPTELRIPVPVTIEQIALEDVAVRTPGAPVRRIERLQARLALGPRELRVANLALAAPLLDAEGRARMRMEAPYRIDGRIDWRARPPGGIAAMAGQLTLGGSLEDLDLALDWKRPAAARLTARLRLFGERPEWQARLDLPATGLRDWWADAPGLGAAAHLALRGSLDQAAVTGSIDLTGLPTGPLRTHLELQADTATRHLRLERVRVEPERPGAWLEARGDADLSGEAPRVDLDLAWRDLAWPLAAANAGTEVVATSESGGLRLRGTPADFHLSGRGAVWTPAMGDPAQLSWRGRGSTTGMERLQLEARWRGARLQTAGEVYWAQARRARFDFDLRELDPGRFHPALSGRLQADGSIRVAQGQSLRAALDLRELSGELNGRPVEGRARAAWADGHLRLDAVDLAAGDARLQAAGALEGERLALDWALTVPDLAQLLPEATGRIEGEGHVSGEPGSPSVRLDVSASRLAFADASIAAVRLHGQVVEAGHQASRLSLRVRDLQMAGMQVRRLAVDLDGRRAEHRLDAGLSTDRGDAAWVLTGALDGADWHGHLQRADLASPQAGRWRLEAPAALAFAEQRLSLDPACWRSDGARACLQGRGRAGDWRALIRAEEVAIARIAALWRPDLSYEGSVGLSAELAQQGGGPVTGVARVRLTPGRITGTIGDTATTLVEYGAGQLEATLGPQRLDARLELPLTEGGRVAATVGLGREPPRPLAGRLIAEVHDLGLAAELLEPVSRVQGRLRADLHLDGSVEAPQVSGSASVDGGEVMLPDLGIRVRGLTVAVETADGAITAELGAESGQGTLSASMQLSHAGAAGWQGSGTVEGASVTAVDLPELHAVVTPDLRWRLDGREIAVEGRVVLPSARIEPRDLSNTVQASPDAVIIQPRADAAPGTTPDRALGEDTEIAGWRVTADVRVVIGENVRINAFGLDADLGGDIRIIQQPGQVTNATGELSVVEGTYTIYRQTLTIERGRVIFASGPLSDPGLDIRAVRRPRDVLVGVNVRGTLRQPRVELFSEPPMEESQVLSYLIVGVPMGETSSGERSSVAAAAAALASSRQGERLASELGIDEVTLEQQQDSEGASLVLGRYLSPRLYIGYGIGLLEQADSVRLRYELSRRWTLETESGATSSADLLYSIETD